ncbi:MAG: acyltransferase [Pseudomonadota bacterium]|nr:acyltransferase [Pseudomonadota bacterium]
MTQVDTHSPLKPLPLTRGGPLDALRFMAAFCMVLYHYSFEAPVELAKVHPIWGRGYLATDFFLIVSGYVLGRIYGDRVMNAKMSNLGFFQRRATRVIPAHLIMLGGLVAFVVGCSLIGFAPAHMEFFDWSQLPAQALLLTSVGVPGGRGWNDPSWSLSALLVCYAAFPFLWRAFARIKSPVAALIAGFAVLAAADVASNLILHRDVFQIPQEIGALRALPLFIAGIVLARFSESVAIRPWIARGLGLSALVLLIALQAMGRYDFLSILLIAAMVVGTGATPVKKASHALEKGAVISFSLFITNEPVRIVLFGMIHLLEKKIHASDALIWTLWAITPAIAVAFAVAFHYGVDMPTQRWIKRRRKAARAVDRALEAVAA